jgi:6-phospho-beta-glucosidase
MREVAPKALLVNFTNPAGLVTEALFRYAPEVPAVGVCNVAITTIMEILKQLEPVLGKKITFESAALDTLGLNHLTWHRGFTVDGEDFWPAIMAGFIAEMKNTDHPEWDLRTLEVLQMIPNYYIQYYYYTNKKLAGQKNWPPSRAEEVMEIEKSLLEQYADPNLLEPPDDLMERGGAYYSTLATQLLNAHYNDLGEIHIINVRHGNAVPGWPIDWVLEMPCRIDKRGIHPLPAKPLPEACFGLLAQVKMFEILTVDAAVHGDREAAYQALLTHPLGPPADQIQTVLDDMLETHKEFLPQFAD